MKNSKLQKMLKAHKLWIDSNKRQGEPANLCEADIYGADLDFFDRNFAQKKRRNKWKILDCKKCWKLINFG